MTALRRVLLPANAVSLLLAGLFLLSWAVVPSFEQVRADTLPSDRWLLDRHGAPLQVQRVDEHMRRLGWTPLDQVSPALKRAVIATEDRRFAHHPGVDLLAIGAIVKSALQRPTADAAAPDRRHGIRGASTITMQLAGLLDPALAPVQGRRSIPQKLRQAALALALGLHWQRDQVFEAYLNRVSFRGELQGVEAAAQGLFGKSPSALDEAESWLLAALIARPNALPALVAARACRLARSAGATAGADAMPGGGSQSCTRFEALAAARLSMPPSIAPPVALAPHAARLLFAQESGARRQPPLVSSLDRDLQRFATDALRAQLEAIAGRNVRDGALLVVDNRTGEVLAYVGNAGERSSARFVDGVSAPRQAGSTLKPFLYELAIEQRLLTAASLVDDSPVDLVAPNGLYVPKNYDRQFTGWVSLRTALAGSLNVPAVRTLMLVGPEPFADRLRALGFADVKRSGDYYGYSLALGSAEVRLSQLVNAFRTLANGGIASPLVMRPGEAAPDSVRRVMAPAAAFIVSDVLADRTAGARTFGLASALATRGWSAVKTGTSKDMRDNWCIGFSGRYTVGVWVGNFDGSPMHDVSGTTGAAPVWQEVMDYLHRNLPSDAPVPPGGLVRQSTDPAADRPEWFIAGTELDRVQRAPVRGGAPRIVYPGAGIIVAIDPDIPAPHQRLLFAAGPGAQGLHWRIGGRRLAPADRPYPWQPVPGNHRLQLVDAQDRVIDEVRFEVRGAAQTGSAAAPVSPG
ncbi:MAG: penicillin-binding protein 1C [bacterium]|jgi:penicillin-binding protein 1C